MEESKPAFSSNMAQVKSIALKYLLAIVLSIIAVIGAVSWPELLLKDNGRPVPAAEFDPVATLTLPYQLFAESYPGSEIAKAAIAAGAKVLVAADPSIAEPAKWLDGLGFSTAERGQLWVSAIGPENFWIRDYGPVPVRRGNKVELMTAQYPGSDSEIEAFSTGLAKALSLQKIELPVLLEGGNILTDGARCLMSAPLPSAPLARGAGASVDIRADLATALGAGLGCQALVFIAEPPHEHIDMYLKILSRGEALVGALDEKALALFRDEDGNLSPEYTELAKSLDRVATQLSELYKIRRVPQPLPFRGSFPSYTNALLINGTAILPRYQKFGFRFDEYPDASLFPYYEEKARAAYADAGFKVIFVNADALLYNGGALHCAGLQIPRAGRL